MTLLLAVAAASGCGTAPSADSSLPPTFPAEPFQRLTTAGALFDVALRTAPQQPPQRGIDTLQYQVTDPSGAPVTGLVLTVVPWMPAHGHGTSVRPTVTETGDGLYEASNVVLFMQGRWELRTSITGGGAQDAVAPAFDVN